MYNKCIFNNEISFISIDICADISSQYFVYKLRHL
jgi:hypothetical protein